MRPALLASLALTATLTSAFAPSIAEACGGGYMPDPTPRVYAFQSHGVINHGAAERWQHRAFILMFPTQRPQAGWEQLAPGTYDYTKIGAEQIAATPLTMTLVGPSGTTVVSSKRRAVVSRQWSHDNAFSAIEVAPHAGAQFRIAVPGSQPDAKWLAVGQLDTSKQLVSLAKDQGLDTSYLDVSEIEGTELRVVSAHRPDEIGRTSIVLSGTTNLGAFAGSPIGGLELGGKRYVLLERDGVITPVAV